MSPSIRAAASVVLRPAPGDERVYLVRRNPKLRWFAGFWAFPGGTVGPDEADFGRLVEDADAELARFVFCAARELLEETGLSFHGESQAERRAWREATLEDDAAFARGLQRQERELPGKRFVPVARLLTPDFHPVRFDTVFFRVDLAGDPPLPEPEIWEGELVEGRWDTPARWL